MKKERFYGDNMKKFNVGVIGLGNRGSWWVTEMLLELEYVNIVGLCDVYADRIEKIRDQMLEKGFTAPAVQTVQYRELIDAPQVDTVLIFSAWSNHVDAALYAMKAGKPVGMEVGGAYGLEQCWELVRTYQQTQTPFMLLENCCYGEYELMALNMAKRGALGEIVHCDGGYMHDLRDEVARGNETRHYRFNEYLTRNAENYPTHEIGPISKLLHINNGNRFESLVSVSSRSAGLHAYICAHEELKEKYGDLQFKQGDIVNTLIRCADGSTVAIALDTTLPRYYSRNFTVRGTKGMYDENTQSFFFDGEDHSQTEWDWSPEFGNRQRYKEKWQHPIWKHYYEVGVKEQGHGGMDFLVIDAFFEALDQNLPMPIDVYDAACWMAITALSAKSITLGSQPVEFPDFTEGKWQKPQPQPEWKYAF